MPKKNGFFFFMLDFKKIEEAKGRKFRGLEQVSGPAGEVWAKMNAQQREPYNQQAKKESSAVNNRGLGKLTSLGVPVTEIEQQNRDLKSKVERQKTRISTLLNTAATKNALEKLEFYFISMAYFCRTHQGEYLPAELAVVRYSLEGGVKDKLHMFLNPGPLPLGMAYEAKKHAEDNHQLPIPPNAMGESDFGEVMMKLVTFLLKDDTSNELPLLYTDQDDVPKVENMLEVIFGDQLDDMEVNVCPLAELFFRLKQSVELFMMDQTTFPSVHIAQQIILKDVYDYTKGISCEYHEAQDNVLNCSLSRCTRWGYMISDNCCQDMGIEPIPGKHVPMNANINPTVCTFELTSLGTQDDRESFVSGSNTSHFTSPIVGDSFASCQGAGGSGAPRPTRNDERSPLRRVEQLVTKRSKQEESDDEEEDDDKTEVQETINRSAAGFNISSIASGSQWPLEGASVANVRGAGRGRGQLLEQFPPLSSVGGRGRARRFL
uniref:HMG box domain-containing protein n=1 Tax=Anopheles epiroticus TaxID=199890 RepID=A0A182PRJ3_9DIPT